MSVCERESQQISVFDTGSQDRREESIWKQYSIVLDSRNSGQYATSIDVRPGGKHCAALEEIGQSAEVLCTSVGRTWWSQHQQDGRKPRDEVTWPSERSREFPVADVCYQTSSSRVISTATACHRPITNTYRCSSQTQTGTWDEIARLWSIFSITQVTQLLLRMSRSYGVVWNSRTACWLTMAIIPGVEIWTVCLFTVFLMYITDGSPMPMVQEVERLRWCSRCRGLKVVKSCSKGKGEAIGHFCGRMYSYIATVHFVTVRNFLVQASCTRFLRCVRLSGVLQYNTIQWGYLVPPYTEKQTGRHYNSHRMCIG